VHEVVPGTMRVISHPWFERSHKKLRKRLDLTKCTRSNRDLAIAC
jgi:hypothetical protein